MRQTPVDLGEYPLHPPSCGAHVPHPEHKDCSLGCDCGLEELRRDFKIVRDALATVLLQVCNGSTAPDSVLRQMLSNAERTSRDALREAA